MRWLVVTTSLLAALWLATPPSAWAQDPPPPPPPTPDPAPPPPPPPPPQARERETAVSRTERAREAVMERQERSSRESEPAREAQSADRAGSSRREVVRDNAAPEVRTGEESDRRRPAVNVSSESSAATSATAGADDQAAQRRGAVRRPPSDARGGVASPRDRAVVRTGPPPDRDRDLDRVYVYPDYWSYGLYYDPFYYGGVHLGYLAYSPWGWMPSFYGYPYGYGGGYGGGYYQARGYDIGRVKLKVKPRDAEVYVDGYFAGSVDDFDGFTQALRLDSGGYRIEIRKPGFETLQFDVRVQPDRTITYRGEMRPTP